MIAQYANHTHSVQAAGRHHRRWRLCGVPVIIEALFTAGYVVANHAMRSAPVWSQVVGLSAGQPGRVGSALHAPTDRAILAQ